MIKILFVCLGNICRSACAEAVMKKKVQEAGREKEFFIDSAGILSYHEGERADYRMREAGFQRGYNVDSISRPVKTADFEKFDLIIGMDNSNIDDLYDRAPDVESTKKIHKMTEYCTRHTDDHVPDPYYGGRDGFYHVIELLEDACDGLLRTTLSLP